MQLDGAFGHAHADRDFTATQALDLTKDNRFPRPRRDLIERRLHPAQFFTGDCRFVGPRCIDGNAESFEVFYHFQGDDLLPAHPVHQEIVRCSEDERLCGRWTFVACRFIDPDIDVLQKVSDVGAALAVMS